ncbi:MAG TPA: alpha/beta hydrolase [Terriglobales bacterium]|nr:alpha/beta hydrolase [Terriglobales bacterium]
MAGKDVISRRTLLTGAASCAAGGLAGTLLARKMAAQTPPGASAGAAEHKIWSHEYWAKKGDVSLYIFRKRMGNPAEDHEKRPILFLAHGSSVSSRPTFDLQVPGHDDEYSLMDKFASYGFDVWTMDFEGYGRSSRGAGNSDVATGAEDLKAASAVVLRETGLPRFHLYGESGGALRAGVFAMAEPQLVDRLAFIGFTWTGKGSPTLKKRAEMVEYYRTHNRRPRDRNMIRSIFTRDKPGTSDPAVAGAMADAELKFGDTAPTGTYLDMTTKLPLVDPLKLQSPVMIARGEYDGIATEQDLLNFFQQLPVPDREFVILPGAAHAIALGKNRRQFWHVLRCYLEMPPRLDIAATKAAGGSSGQ